jgi:hypothetical protein
VIFVFFDADADHWYTTSPMVISHRLNKQIMITRSDNISQQSLPNGKASEKRENDAYTQLSSVKAGEKARKLMRSIMADFPADDDFVSHNFD